MSFALHQIPGYAEALAAATERDFTTREDAWWDFSFDVGGVRLRTMTVQDYEVMQRVRTPLLLRQMPNPDEMLLFLWLLSPEYERRERSTGLLRGWRRDRARRKYYRLCEKILDLENLQWLEKAHALKTPDKPFQVPDDSPYAKVFVKCVEYIDRMFYDRPAGLRQTGNASGMCYLTGWFCTLQREFSLPTAEIQKMGLPEMFARLREVQMVESRGRVPDFSQRLDALNKQVMDALRGGMTETDLLAGKLRFKLN